MAVQSVQLAKQVKTNYLIYVIYITAVITLKASVRVSALLVSSALCFTVSRLCV